MAPPRKQEWFDDDAFWRECYPFIFSEERIAEAAGEAEQALALTSPPGKDVLDLCCGPGRFSVVLAERGFSVTGVDRTEFLLEKARARAAAAGVEVDWVRADMRDFVRAEAFDLLLNMYTSFGYFDRKEDDARVLANMHSSLRPGGVCLIDVVGKERLARIFQPTTAVTLPDGGTLVQQHEIFDDWTRIRNVWTVIDKGKARRFPFHHTIYSGQELRDRLEQAGFVDVTLYGDLDGNEYGPEAVRLVAVGRKEKG